MLGFKYGSIDIDNSIPSDLRKALVGVCNLEMMADLSDCLYYFVEFDTASTQWDLASRHFANLFL